MNAGFSFQVDPTNHLVRITLSGFFGVDDVARFAAARDVAHLQLRCGPNQHLTLADIREMQIQPQVSVDEFQQVLANPRTRSKRIAFVVAKSLARLQIQRAACARAPSYFTCPDEAERWLLSATTAAAA